MIQLQVAAKKCAETMALARKVNDVQAIVFLQKCMQQMVSSPY
jgi:hypothetical protein